MAKKNVWFNKWWYFEDKTLNDVKTDAGLRKENTPLMKEDAA